MDRNTIEQLWALEPELKQIAERAAAHRRRPFYEKLEAYAQAKNDADTLLGWNARDPRLRGSEAWDCFFTYLLDELNI